MIEKILITSFIVYAIWYTYQEGEIFVELGKFFERNLPTFMHQPVFECPVCMAFWYGSVLYWVAWGNNWQEWLLVVISALGLNAILNKLFPPDEIEIKEENGDQAELSKAISVLTSELRKDKKEGSYYYHWQSDIAIPFIYNIIRERKENENGKYEISPSEIHDLANKTAMDFLDQLIYSKKVKEDE